NRFARTNCPPHARRFPFPHNRAARRHQDRTADASARPAPCRCRQRHRSRVQAAAKSEPLYLIQQVIIARLLSASARSSATWKALPRAAQTACRCCLAKSAVPETASLAEYGESVRSDALLWL